MAKLTNKELEALAATNKATRIRENGGLIGNVRPRKGGAASIQWNWRYRFNGKVRQLSCGTWPNESMPTIRKERDRLAAIVSSGRDPAQDRQVIKLQARAEQLEGMAKEQARIDEAQALQARMTVQDLFNKWARIELTGRKDGGKEVRRSFEKDTLPKLGNLAAEDVKRSQIAQVLDAIVERGARIVARNMLGDIRQMYGFAIKRGWLDYDPTSHMKRDDYGKKKERERVLTEAEIKKLATALPTARMGKTSELAIWLQLATCCRTGELSRALWKDIDLDAGTWRIPGHITKNTKEHTITLSAFALERFKALHRLTGAVKDKQGDKVAGIWAFPARFKKTHVCVKTLTKQVGDRQRGNKAVMSNRTKLADALTLPGGKWTPHDLRRTGATMMVALGVLPEVVERCLNHVEQNRVKRIYQRHSYATEMQHAWKLLGERIELLIGNADNVIPIQQRKGKAA